MLNEVSVNNQIRSKEKEHIDLLQNCFLTIMFIINNYINLKLYNANKAYFYITCIYFALGNNLLI